jgi:hypothetical protein
MANGIAKRIKKKYPKPPPLPGYVDQQTLEMWDSIAECNQLREILRLAKIGMWSEQNAGAIRDSLHLALGELAVTLCARFEKALAGAPKARLDD